MSPRQIGRTETCGTQQARVRLGHARAFLDVAELVGSDPDEVASHGVCAAMAVLAGIAASDAACCAVLGRCARTQDHRQATALLAKIVPGGPAMARDLNRLLAVKDDAHYGVLHVSGQRAAAALQQARRLVEAATRQIQ